MLKRVFCTVFLAIFCLGSVAYGTSNEDITKKLESVLRKELTSWILETARQECRQAGLNMPQEISIEMGNYNSETCLLFLGFSSYVPEEPVKKIARFVGAKVATIIKEKGWYSEGVLIVVQPCEHANGVNFYDAQALLHQNGDFIFETIPREEIMKMLDMND